MPDIRYAARQISKLGFARAGALSSLNYHEGIVPYIDLSRNNIKVSVVAASQYTKEIGYISVKDPNIDRVFYVTKKAVDFLKEMIGRTSNSE